MNKLTASLFGIFFFIFLAGFASALDISACQDLDSANTWYSVTTNVYRDSSIQYPCFRILANNITLDCNNYWINQSGIGYNRGNVGLDDEANQTTIQNCLFGNFSYTGILIGGDFEYMPPAGSSNNTHGGTYTNITIASAGSFDFGIYIYKVDNTTFRNFRIISGRYGIYSLDSRNGTFYNISINVSGASTVSGILAQWTSCPFASCYASFYNTSVVCNYIGAGGALWGPNQFLNFTNTNISGQTYSVTLGGNYGVMHNYLSLLNATFDKSKMQVTDPYGTSANEIQTQWYLNVHVIDEVGADVAGANANISSTRIAPIPFSYFVTSVKSNTDNLPEEFRNNTGSIDLVEEAIEKNPIPFSPPIHPTTGYMEWNVTTNATGWATLNVTEFSRNVTGAYNFTPHYIVGSKHSYAVNSTSANVTQNTDVTLVLSHALDLQFVNPTRDDGNVSIDYNWIYVNVSYMNSSDIDAVVLNWNGTNETNTMACTNSTDGYCEINKTGLADGNYTFYVFMNQTDGVGDQTETRWNALTSSSLTTCLVLNIPGTTYLLGGNIIDSPLTYCMRIMANNITLDCQNYKIDGLGTGGSIGIWVDGVTGTKIRNCTVSDWQYGIYNDNSGYSTFEYNNITNDTQGQNVGLRMDFSSTGATLYSNSFTNNGVSIVVGSGGIADYLNASENTFYGVGYGYYSDSGTSTNNSLFYHNTFYGGEIYIQPGVNNTLDCAGAVMDGSISNYVGGAANIFFGHGNNTVKNCIVQYNGQYGIDVDWDYNNTVVNNTISHMAQNYSYGLLVAGNTSNISYNIVLNSTAGSNSWCGSIDHSISSTFHNNNFTDCYNGLQIQSPVDNSRFYNNIFSNVNLTIRMNGKWGVRNNYFQNNIFQNVAQIGILSTEGTYNTIFQDNTINSVSGAYDVAFGDPTGSAMTGNSLIFINTTFNKSALIFYSGVSDSNLTVKWYVDVHVINNATSADIAGASVDISNTQNTGVQYEYFNETTNGTGWIPKLNITELYANGATYNFTPHQIIANATGYRGNVTADNNITDNSVFTITLLNASAITCATLNTPDTIYTLTDNITTASGICLYITANNVTVDCVGYSINNIGVAISAVMSIADESTVKNCFINNFTGTSQIDGAIDINGNYTNVTNNTVRDSNIGIRIGFPGNLVEQSNASYNIVDNSTLYGVAAYVNNSRVHDNNVSNASIYILMIGDGAQNTYVYNNRVSGVGQAGIEVAIFNSFIYNNTVWDITTSTGYGIDLNYISDGGNNTVENNTVFGNLIGIIVRGSDLHTISNNNVSYNTVYGIRTECKPQFVGCNNAQGMRIINNIVRDSQYGISVSAYSINTALGTILAGNWIYNASVASIYATNVNDLFDQDSTLSADYSQNANDSYIAGQANITFINETFNKTAVKYGDSSSRLSVKWYTSVHVVNSTGDDFLGGANVNISNSRNTSTAYEYFNETTNGTGWIPQKNVTEYSQISSATYNFTPHYIAASADGYLTNLTVGNDISHDPVFTIVLIEATPINMSIDAPINGSLYYDNETLTINVTAITAGTLDSAITNDSVWSGIFSPTGNYFNLSNTSTLSVGTHCVNVVVNDTIGDTNSSYVCFQINSSVAGGLSNCANLTTPDSSYVLLNNLYTTGTCINISANNVSVNCGGFKIYGDNVGNDYGILVYNWTNQSSITNCFIQNFTNGIYFERSNWSNATANTIYNSSFAGMRPYYSDNILIYNNNISYVRSLATGIYATRATNSNYSYNKLNFDDGGLAMDGGSNYNTIQNNNFSNSPYGGIALLSSNNNLFIGNILYRIAEDAIYPMSSNENVFRDTLIYAEPAFGAHNALSFDKSNGTIFINLTIANYAVGYRTVATSQNTIFVDSLFDLPSGMRAFDLHYSSNVLAINTTFNKSQTTIGSGTNNLTVKWYADVHTIDGVGADVASANVNISNTLNAGTYEFFNDTTNATGWTGMENVTEYYQNVSGTYNYTPHRFVGSKTVYITNTTNYQVTSSGHYSLVLLANVVPAIIQVNSISAQTPSSCGLRTIPNTVFYAYDDNGYLDILNSSAYANFTNGTKTYQTTSCTATYINATTTRFNCTGVSFDYRDASGAWNMIAYVADQSGLTITNNSQSMTYNTLVSMTATQLITFGACGPGSTNCVNTNSPAFNLTNCGNIALNSSITGMDIGDGAGHVLAIGDFRVDDDAQPNGGDGGNKVEMTLTTGAQAYDKPIGVGTYWQLWYFLNVPTTQYPTIYNVGYWVWTPSVA